MSIQGREITIGSKTYTLEDLSIERTLRLTDIVFTVLDQFSDKVQTEFSEYVAKVREERTQVVSPGDALSDEDRELVAEAGYDPDNLTEPVLLVGEPTQEEVIGFFLPRAWKIARPQVLTLFALVLATNAGMADAEDEEGGIDAYLKGIAKQVKHEGRTPDLLVLAGTAFEVAKDEFERVAKSGKLPAPLAGLASFGESEPSQASTADEPTPSTSSPTPTAGTEPQSSTE